jgi:hypothetical protein
LNDDGHPFLFSFLSLFLLSTQKIVSGLYWFGVRERLFLLSKQNTIPRATTISTPATVQILNKHARHRTGFNLVSRAAPLPLLPMMVRNPAIHAVTAAARLHRS